MRQICREYQISHHTLEKMLQGVEPPDYQQRPGKRPRLGPFLGVIDQIFEDDQTAPKTQRHTAKRIFEPLRAEHGYAGCRARFAHWSRSAEVATRRSSCRSPRRRARTSSTSARPSSRSPTHDGKWRSR
jgi:hypothetical protein